MLEVAVQLRMIEQRLAVDQALVGVVLLAEVAEAPRPLPPGIRLCPREEAVEVIDLAR